jgi:hypothetical protein
MSTVLEISLAQGAKLRDFLQARTVRMEIAMNAVLGSRFGTGLGSGRGRRLGRALRRETLVLLRNTVAYFAPCPPGQRTIASTLVLNALGVAFGVAMGWIVATFAWQLISTSGPADQTSLAPAWEYVVQVDCERGGSCNAKTVKYPKESPPAAQQLTRKYALGSFSTVR